MSDTRSEPARKAPFYIPSLDGLRAVAVMIVFFSHVGLSGLMPGGFGVTIFFFLSGFLITTLLRMEEDKTGDISLKQFYLRRVLRIFPPMYLAIVFAAACSVAVGEALHGKVLAIQALHLTNYHVALGGGGRPLGTHVLWSLSVEEHFYLLFPFLYIVLRRVVEDRTRIAIILLGICGVMLAWRFFLVTRLGMEPEYTTHASDARMDSILYGCALALWRNPALPGPQISDRVTWIGLVVGLVVLLATIAARGVLFRETLRYSLQGLALAPVFVAAIRFPRSIVFRALDLRPVRWLGLLSYSLYLVHLPIIEVLRRSRFAQSPVAMTLIAFALSVALSAVIYRFVEKPCAKLRKRLSRVAHG